MILGPLVFVYNLQLRKGRDAIFDDHVETTDMDLSAQTEGRVDDRVRNGVCSSVDAIVWAYDDSFDAWIRDGIRNGDGVDGCRITDSHRDCVVHSLRFCGI